MNEALNANTVEFWSNTLWGLLFFGITAFAAVVVWRSVKVLRSPQRVQAKLALPLAIVERAVEDALQELVKCDRDDVGIEELPSGWMSFGKDDWVPTPAPDEPLFVSAFEHDVQAFLQIPPVDIAALGQDAFREYGTLVRSIRAWNERSGEQRHPKTLLPTILVAHHAVQNLGRLVEKTTLEAARREAQQRVLVGLLAPAHPHHPAGESDA